MATKKRANGEGTICFSEKEQRGGQRSLGLMLMETNGGKSGRTKNSQRSKQNLPSSKSNSCYSE